MNENMQKYIDSIESVNSRKVARFSLNGIDDNVEAYNLMQLEQNILNKKPSSPKEITTILYILSAYAKFLQEQGIMNDDNFLQVILSLDKKLLWNKAKKNAKKKFINNEQYEEIVKSIATYEQYNALYFELLFGCIWFGLYNEDLSVLKNLRSSDIQDDGLITLREDNQHTYKIKVSERFAKDLKQLSTINVWQRPNRFSICNVEMTGVYHDSVFKTEKRTSNSDGSYKFSYYSKLRKISKEHIGYSVLPLQLYVSGIMHRIKVELEENNITLEEAFSDNNRNRMAHMIIEKELIRSNSGIKTSNLRELVKGHINNF